MIGNFYSELYNKAIQRNITSDAERFCPEGEETVDKLYVSAAHAVRNNDAFNKEMGERIRDMSICLRSPDEKIRTEAAIRMQEIEAILSRFEYLSSLDVEAVDEAEDLSDIKDYEANPIL
jgi:hypothetical protein